MRSFDHWISTGATDQGYQPVLETAQVTLSVGTGSTQTPPGRLVASKVKGSEASVVQDLVGPASVVARVEVGD
jgi:hypothetical protein